MESGTPTQPRQVSSSSIIDSALVGDVVILLCCTFQVLRIDATARYM